MEELFLEHLVAISDCNKGLNEGLNKLKLSKTLVHFYCYQHFEANTVTDQEKSAIIGFFWNVA